MPPRCGRWVAYVSHFRRGDRFLGKAHALVSVFGQSAHARAGITRDPFPGNYFMREPVSHDIKLEQLPLLTGVTEPIWPVRVFSMRDNSDEAAEPAAATAVASRWERFKINSFG